MTSGTLFAEPQQAAVVRPRERLAFWGGLAAALAFERWSRSFGQIGGFAKLIPGVVHAANSVRPAISGVHPGSGRSICVYASSGVRPASAECGLATL